MVTQELLDLRKISAVQFGSCCGHEFSNKSISRNANSLVPFTSSVASEASQLQFEAKWRTTSYQRVVSCVFICLGHFSRRVLTCEFSNLLGLAFFVANIRPSIFLFCSKENKWERFSSNVFDHFGCQLKRKFRNSLQTSGDRHHIFCSKIEKNQWDSLRIIKHQLGIKKSSNWLLIFCCSWNSLLQKMKNFCSHKLHMFLGKWLHVAKHQLPYFLE